MISGCSLIEAAQGRAQRPIYESIPVADFRPVERPNTNHEQASARSVRIEKAAPGVDIGGGHSVRGQASWYCQAGVSVCHHAYSGGLYAAAGPALRVGDWRGRAVTVSAGGESVRVKLIDWCSCGGGRVIDLYSDAFRRLAPLSSGVVRVRVEW